jgi:hypothetical protein
VLPLSCIGKYPQFYQYVCRPNDFAVCTESDIKKFTDEHNAYLKELGVNLLKSP